MLPVKAKHIVDGPEPKGRVTILKKSVDTVGRVGNRQEWEMLRRACRGKQMGQPNKKESTHNIVCVIP